MARLKYISVIQSAPVLFKLASMPGTPLWNPVLPPVRLKNTHLLAWKTGRNVVRSFLGFDFRRPLYALMTGLPGCGSQLENGSDFYGNNNGIDSTAPFHRYDPNGLYCDMGCEGNPNELCGGPALLDLYNFTGTYPIGASVVPSSGAWTSIGCYRYGLAFTNF
jgi:hypothetical protein